MEKTPTESEMKKNLTKEQYHVLREKGTEMAFTGKFHKTKEKGMYTCAGCGAEAEVPFVPRLQKPVYCRACFDKQKGGGGGRSPH